MPSIEEVIQMYITSFLRLRYSPKPTTDEQEIEFTNMLEEILASQNNVGEQYYVNHGHLRPCNTIGVDREVSTSHNSLVIGGKRILFLFRFWVQDFHTFGIFKKKY